MPAPRWLKSVILTGADWLERNGFYRLAEKWGGGRRTWSGETVTDQGALTHSVVWACVRIISESVAFMPLNLMQEKDGSKNPAKDHPLWRALHDEPNAEMTTMTMRETMTGHLVMKGNCFAQITRRSGSGEAIELWPLTPEDVMIDREKEGQRRLVYVVKEGNSSSKTYTVERGKAQDILHIPGLGWDGMKGYDVLGMAANSIGNAQAVERYAGRHFATGGRQSGYIELSQKMASKEAMQQFREDLDKRTQNPETAHKWAIFEPGMKFVPSGAFSAEQSQFLGTREWTPSEICRWFLISPHMVNDLSHATFSNIEHLALQFVKMTLTSWITRWEQNLKRCVLTPDEKAGGYYFKHNVDGLLRGDFASRMAGYATMLQNGPFSIDEVRDLEDRNPLPKGLGKDHRVQLNMQVVGQPPPVLTAGQKDMERVFQLEQLIQSLSKTLSYMQSKENLQ